MVNGFRIHFLFVLIAGCILVQTVYAQRTSNMDWETVWVNLEPDETDIHNPNIWMAGDNRYTGIAYDKWNDVLYIASPDMCLLGEEPVPCPKIHVWDAETGAVATRIAHAGGLAPPGQLFVNPDTVWGGLRVKIDEGYLVFRIDLDDEGRIYVQNLSGRVHYPYLRYDPLHIYRWNSPYGGPELIAEGITAYMFGTSLEVTGKRHLINNQVVDSTRIYMSGGQQPVPHNYMLEDIYVWLPDTRTNASLPFYKAQTLKHNEAGSFMAAHGIAATSTRAGAMLYMDSNSRPLILNHQQPLMTLNLAVNPDVTGPSGPVKYYLDTLVNVPYLIVADGRPSSLDTGVVNTNTTARVIDLSGEPHMWPSTPTPALGDSMLYNFWGPDNWVSDVDYKIWTNPATGHLHMQVFVLMSNNGIGCFRTRAPMYYPVEMETFRGEVDGNTVALTWQVAGESNNRGFEVYRSFNGSDWEKIGFVEGRGTVASAYEYRFDDLLTSVHRSLGKVQYRLKQVDFDGNYKWTEAIAVYIGTPGENAVLFYNYPNPVHSGDVATMSYQIYQPADVSLKVYDTLGEEVATLEKAVKPAGMHTVKFNTTGLPPGVYLYRLTVNEGTSTKRVVVTK